MVAGDLSGAETMQALFPGINDAQSYAAALPTREFGKRLIYISETDSTNDLAMSAARSGEPGGTVFIADLQKCGRGRRGRSWDCPPGLGLLFSIIFRPRRLSAANYGWVPLVSGLACIEAI